VLLPPPPEQLVSTMTTLEIGGLVVVAVVGLAMLWRLWAAARRAPAGSEFLAQPLRTA
jgi:hypothetical protein